MIKFKALSLKVGDLLPLSVINYKLSEVINHPRLVAQLKEMTFDSRFTKPFTLTGWDVYNFLREVNVTVKVGLYTQPYLKWKFTPVNAYKPAGKPDEIYFNLRQIPRRDVIGINSSEETLWHDLVHIADHARPEQFSHGDNSPKGKKDSAPAKFARFMASVQL